MKFFFVLLFIPACLNGKAQKPVSDSTKGDFNGDGNMEAAVLKAPQLNSTQDECVKGDCTAYILFTPSSKIGPIIINNCIGGTPDNLGDLDGDGADEIGLHPDWFTSCWQGYFVFTYKKGKWKPLVPTITTHCIQWEKGIRPIEKDPKQKGYAIIHYSKMNEDGEIVVRKKRVKLAAR